MPRRVTVRADDLNGYDVQVEVEPARGRLVAVSVEVMQRRDGPAVTGEALRSVPVAALTKEASAHLMPFKQKDGYVEMGGGRVLTPEVVDGIHEAGPSQRSLEWVAYLYQLAVLRGDPPTKTVETALRLPRSTAGRWVALARREGHLGPAEGPGKAGG